MTIAYVGLGANLGDLHGTLERALGDIGRLPGTRVLQVSGAWRSAPVGAEGPDYLNAVARIQSSLAPLALLRALLQIEQQHGRERPFRHAPRTLDLDLLLYADRVQDDPELILPHPRLHQRAFVLLPLLELDAALELPGLGRADRFLADVGDQRMERLSTPLQAK